MPMQADGLFTCGNTKPNESHYQARRMGLISGTLLEKFPHCDNRSQETASAPCAEPHEPFCQILSFFLHLPLRNMNPTIF